MTKGRFCGTILIVTIRDLTHLEGLKMTAKKLLATWEIAAQTAVWFIQNVAGIILAPIVTALVVVIVYTRVRKGQTVYTIYVYN